MSGFEIAVVTITVVGFATLGLQQWYCSRSIQNETSTDSITFDLKECAIKNGEQEVNLQNLHFKISESDKSSLKKNSTEGKVGDKDVSRSAINILGSITGGKIPAIANSAINPETIVSTNLTHDIESNLPLDGPRGTHAVQDHSTILNNFTTALLTFITTYTQNQLPNEDTAPLLHSPNNAATLTLAGNLHDTSLT